MRWLVPFSFLLPLTISTAAFADGDNKNCPPGSWFCESISIGGGGDPDAAKTPEPTNGDLATSPDDAPAKKRRARPRVDPDADGPEAAVTDGDPDTVVIVRKRRPHRTRVVARDRELPPGMVPGPRRERWREHFGLNLRVEGAAFIPRNGDDLAGMGGAGASFRWRPSPFFAFDLGGDIVGGNDYDNNGRVEFAGSLSGLLYFNPQHRVQVYAIGGLHLSHAEVGTTCYDVYPTTGYYGDYYGGGCGASSRNYFGGQFGLGLEFRIARHFGLFADALGIIRTRIDDSSVPEFTDYSTGETTNTSGAMLMRTGVNFWW